MIASTIKALRESQGIPSQSRFSRLTGISRQTINYWENGKCRSISRANLQKLKDTFNLPPGQIEVLSGVEPSREAA